MSLVALIGDCTTTTSVAVAASWPTRDEIVILEADPSGGSLTGWLDTPPTPSLSTIVAQPRSATTTTPTTPTTPTTTWSAIDSAVQRSASGIRFIAAPVRAREASRAIDEAGTALWPMFTSSFVPTVLADCGRHTAADRLPAAVSLAATIVIIHRQENASALAASVRLERLAETINGLGPLGVPIELAVIGTRPFYLDEIHRFVSGDTESVRAHALADDELSAAVFAGRSGVSSKRLGRLPLIRSVRSITDAVRQSLGIDEDRRSDRSPHGSGAGSRAGGRDDARGSSWRGDRSDGNNGAWLDQLGTMR